ncbi:tetratricopeptide repeat protein [Ramlibacter monticola]|uniref:Tetratricopeptide repeat protein n=1 Tax=Ramlibacter monticola TaxID=1926872 RepID=A0A936Z9F3_9BURK|nr:tetratricopeptide repeat protein [Ramlibacter monticola]MBL0394871.1 tetratricopeptide repeat protein [Ramlibacter monticola]
MKFVHAKFRNTLGLAVIAAALFATGGVRADEYGDVNQLLRSGKLTEALNKADQYLAGKPKDPQMRFLKGVVLTEAGRPAEAIATFQKLTEDYPELPEPYNNLAVLYAGQGQFDKARASLEMAIRTNPSYATAHENLGDVYAKLASQAYSRALQLDSGNTAVQPKLALIRELFAAPGSRAAPGAAAPRGGAVVAAAATTAPAARPAAATPAVAAVAAAPATTPAPAAAARPATPAPAAGGAPTPAPAAVAAAPTAPTPTAAAPAASSESRAAVEAAIKAWAQAWAAKDMGGYLGAYGKEFDPPGNQSRQAWEQERRARILGKSKIAVQVSDLDVSVNGNKAVARFKQNYSADALHVNSRKTLELVKSGERWAIVRESTGG